MEPPNIGHDGDEHFVHCSEVVPLLEVEMYGQLMEGGKQFVHCREVCPLIGVSIIGGFTVLGRDFLVESSNLSLSRYFYSKVGCKK